MDNELQHHGILGMKWGVRRYQNKDGSYTSAGKKRKTKSEPMSNEELMSNVRRLNLEKQYKNLSKEAGKSSKLDKTKKVVDASSNLVNQAKNLNRESINSTRKKEKLDLSKMTDQQLRERINRENLENQYNNLFGEEKVTVSKGRAYATDILDVAGSILAIGGSSLGIALAIKDLRLRS